MLPLPSIIHPVPSPKPSSTLDIRVAMRESSCRYMKKEGLKDLTSSSLNIKGKKAAEARDLVDMRTYRMQLKEYPEALREIARVEMQLQEDSKQRDLQDHQMIMLLKLQKLLIEQMIHMKEDPHKFHIGGHERGLYERFFKTEPMEYMSEPQFISAMKKVFGDAIIKKKEHDIIDLYASFDARRRGEMDWRSLLCLICIIMMPRVDVEHYLRYAFIIYASQGSFDLECNDKVSLKSIKQLILIPIRLTFRTEVEELINRAWVELSTTDYECIKAVQNLRSSDIDSVKISLKMFMKMVHQTSFSEIMKMNKPFGKRDLRPWSYRIEDMYYHPVIPPFLRAARREHRNEMEVRKFLATAAVREKRGYWKIWVKLVKIRHRVRELFINASIRWKSINCADYFDIWRKVTIEEASSIHLQRLCRGFVARKRKIFIRSLHRRVVKLQAQVRQVSKRVVFKGIFLRWRWGATTIQRFIRGHHARRRVQGIIEAKVDTEVRLIHKAREKWIQQRREEKVVVIQEMIRKHQRKKRVIEKVQKRFENDRVLKEQNALKSAATIEREKYKAEMKKWYDLRREEYFKNRLDKNATAAAKIRIHAYRNREKQKLKQAQEAHRDLMRRKMEENKVEEFVKRWEILTFERTKEYERSVRQCLLVPETPEEQHMKDRLIRQIKDHVPVVLKRADKQKIPMEIPEAKEVAQEEIIQLEMKEEQKRIKEDMRAEANRIEQEEAEALRKEKLLEAKRKFKRRGWASVVIQKSWRGYVGRTAGRNKAFLRYKKHYDKECGEFYYEDFKTKKTQWRRPICLGSYDVEADDGWIVLRDSIDDPYYFHPRTMTMKWDTPFDTVFCENCKRDFAVGRLGRDLTIYCDGCMQEKVSELMMKLPPSRIWWKPINGNIENSALKLDRIEEIEDKSWADYLDSLDPSHTGKKKKEGEEEEEEDDLKVEYCGTCEDEEAECKCEMCLQFFCLNCYNSKHAKAPWTNHVKTELKKPDKEKLKQKLKQKEKAKARPKPTPKKSSKKLKKTKEELKKEREDRRAAAKAQSEKQKKVVVSENVEEEEEDDPNGLSL